MAMAIAAADTTIQSLLKIVGQLLLHEVTLLLGVKGEVSDLASKLGFINDFLRDSKEKQDDVRELIRQIQDVGQEAEDVIEYFMLEAEQHRRMNTLNKFVNGPTHVLKLRTVAKDTQRIKEAIDQIYNNFEKYKIKHGENSDPAPPCPMSSPGVQRRRREVEEDMVGRKDEADKIIRKLTTGKPELDFVSIVGLPGLGKTTLARKIYRDEKIRNHFTCPIGWVIVSEGYDTRQVVVGIMKTVMPDRCAPEALAEKSDDDLMEMLKHRLQSERYLIILDDIWGTEMWDEINKKCFPDDGNHSRIMVTSRFKDLADHICLGSEVPLRKLLFKEGWELFSRKVATCPAYLQKLGEDIVRKCDGLPLSIVVVAGILAREKTWAKWKRTESYVNAIVAKDKICNEILQLSYREVPRELKPCFLYFAAFPEDFEVPVRQLIRLWVGEGLIQSRERPMEDVAEDYLQKLIDCSLVQSEKFRMDGGVKTCRIHGLLRQLCIHEAANENFLESRKEINSSASSAGNPRRLSIQCSAPSFIVHNSPKLTHVRSIQTFDPRATSKITKDHWKAVSKGKLLRVLDFGSIEVKEVSVQAGDLLNLRYLKINAPSLRNFPTSIVGLWNLQTLDMRHTKLQEVPIEIYEMQNLRHLLLSRAVNFPERSSDVLDLEWRIQTLSTVAPAHGIATLVRTGALGSMTRLGLCDDRKKADWSLLADLRNLQNLESLKIVSNIYDSNILGKLDPSWFPARLIKVTLKFLNLNSMIFEIFGNLPNLQVLKIHGCWRDLRFRKGSFPNIQALSIANSDLDSWTLEERALPCLERLMLNNCELRQGLPSKALVALTCLKDIRAVKPRQSLKESLGSLKQQVEGKCNVVILP